VLLKYFNLFPKKPKIPVTKSDRSLLLLNQEQTSNKDYSDEIDDCHKQWFMLNKHTFFRPYLAYYYLDLRQLKMYYAKHLHYNYSFVLNLKISIINSDITILKSLNNYKTFVNHGHFNFKLQSLVIDFYLRDLFSNDELGLINDFKNDIKMQVFVETQDKKFKIEKPIEIRIKNFVELPFKKKKKAIICSKQFYFDENYAKSFLWWIELNRMHGYDKLVFYNNSIPNLKWLNDAFRKHSDFIEIKQLQCYPNFEDKDNANKLFIKNSDFKEIYKINPLFHHLHFEYLCYNECFFENKDKYEHIAVHDQDESIIPRRLDKFKVLNPNTKFDLEDFNENTNDKCENKIEIKDYFKNINNQLKLGGKHKSLDFSSSGTLTYHFLMTLFIGHHLMEQIFDRLNEYFEENKQFKEKVSFNITDPNDFNFRGKPSVSFNVYIENENDFEYAQRLFKFYKVKLQPFLKLNLNVFKELPEPFSRLFFINGPRTSWMCGKTVHNTHMSEWVSNHYPEAKKNNFRNVVWTHHEFGHLSHFRTSLKDLHERNVSISNINFDFNYFSCFFRNIAKELNYHIVY